MAQTGTIISCGSMSGLLDWVVDFSYQLDSGGTAQSSVIVGNNSNQSENYWAGLPSTKVALWTSPTSTITVSPNPPGTTNPVVLPCPPLVQYAVFGLAVK